MPQETDQKTPIIAIVGRPNVGKSSLFNRLIHKRLAITSQIAGTTRDRIYHRAEINDLEVVLVDTGGLEYGKQENIEADITTQVKLAIDEADLIYFVVDAKEGMTVSDHEAAKLLRQTKKNFIFIANKADHSQAEHNIPELLKLGFGEPLQISAYHDRGVEELVDETYLQLKKMGFRKKAESGIQKKITNVCFLGKPNVGKSSLINALLGKPKVIVSEIAGTTRDAIDTEISWNGHDYNLIDTAGLRRRGKIEKGLEKLSSFRSIEAIERSDVVCLIMDYREGIKKQDQHIASYILEAKKGLILVINKSDLMVSRDQDEAQMIRILRSRFDFLSWAPVIFTSALRRSNIEKILEIAQKIHNERYRTIDVDELQGFMKDTIYKHLPPIHGLQVPRFFGLEQIGVNPPTFRYEVQDPNSIHYSYRRYLENEMRLRWGFNGTAIKIYYDNRKRGLRKD